MKSLDEMLTVFGVKDGREEIVLAKGTKHELNIIYYHDNKHMDGTSKAIMALIEEINQLKEKVKALETK